MYIALYHTALINLGGKFLLLVLKGYRKVKSKSFTQCPPEKTDINVHMHTHITIHSLGQKHPTW